MVIPNHSAVRQKQFSWKHVCVSTLPDYSNGNVYNTGVRKQTTDAPGKTSL